MNSRRLLFVVLGAGLLLFAVALLRNRSAEPERPITRVNIVQGESSGSSRRSVGTTRHESGKTAQNKASARAHRSGETTTGSARKDDSLVVIGTVQFKDTRAPAPGAVIRLLEFRNQDVQSKQLLAETKSNLDGGFEFRVNATNAQLVVDARLDGYVAEPELAQQNRGMELEGSVRRASILLKPAVRMKGQVVDAAGKGIAGSRIFLSPARTENVLSPLRTILNQNVEIKCGAGGDFDFDGFAVDEIATLLASADGFLPKTMTVKADQPNLQIVLQKEGARVEGYVFDALGVGVSGAKIILRGIPRTDGTGVVPVLETLSDSDGSFVLTAVPEGKYDALCRKDGMVRKPIDGSGEITVPAEGTVRDVKLYMYSGHQIAGKVIEKFSGKPIEGVRIYSVSQPDQWAESDRNGEFLLSTVLPEAAKPWVSLIASRDGYTAGKTAGKDGELIRLPVDRLRVEKDFILIPTLEISGQVVTEASPGLTTPIAAAQIRAFTESGQPSAETATDAAGRFKVAVETENSVRLLTSAPGFAPDLSNEISIREQTTTEVRIALSPGGTITGTVVDESETPIKGARVAIADYGYIPMGMSLTDGNGMFTLSSVPRGEARVIAHHDDYVLEKYVPVNLERGGSRDGVRLTMKRAKTLSGRVTTKDGKPFWSAQITVEQESADGGRHRSGFGRIETDGYYQVTGIAADRVDVKIYSHGFQPADEESLKNVQVRENGLDIVMEPMPEFTLIANVVDAVTSAPISEFSVSSGNATVKKEGLGVATVTGLWVGQPVNVSVSARGYRNAVFNVQATKRDDIVEQTFALMPESAPAGQTPPGQLIDMSFEI